MIAGRRSQKRTIEAHIADVLIPTGVIGGLTGSIQLHRLSGLRALRHQDAVCQHNALHMQRCGSHCLRPCANTVPAYEALTAVYPGEMECV